MDILTWKHTFVIGLSAYGFYNSHIVLFIGLQYITEFRDEDPSKDAQYVCQMCELSCNSGNVLAHILGIKHRNAYLVGCFLSL